MLVVSACSLPVGSLLWQPQPSAWSLTVVCRATILLRPIESVLAEHHEEVAENDDHWDDDPARSLRVASDLVPVKPRADVTVVGHAFAPDRIPVRTLVAHILVGELSKGVEVVADRWVDQEGTLQDGPRFTRMPLVYERASGGPGTVNPVGVAGTANRYGRIALPNLQPPGLLVRSLDDYIAPVGFGPIAPGWPARRERLGRAAVTGTPPDLERPLAEDLDPQYWNHAPRDQQVQMIRDRERIILENLHPEHPRLVTDLPSIRPLASVERRGRSEPVILRCDTLWIDTDRSLCTLTWRGQVPLAHPDEQGRVVFTLDATGQTSPLHEPRPSAHGGDEPEVDTFMLRPLDPDGDTAVPSRTGVLRAYSDKVLPFTASSPQGTRFPEDRASSAGLPFVPPARPSSPALPAPYALSPPAIPPPVPPAIPSPAIPPPLPPAIPSSPIAPPVVPAPRASQPSLDRSLWSVPEPAAGAVALTVGQLAAVQPKPAVPSPRASVPAPSPAQPVPSSPPTTPTPSAPQAEAGAAAAVAAEARASRTNEAAPAAGAALHGTVTEPKLEGKRALQLISFEAETPSRIRRKPTFQPLLAALEDRPLDRELDDPALARDPAPIEDRRDVFEILARGDAADEPGLEDALDRAIRDDGKFVPPFVLLAGELRLAFDEVAALRATISLATPFASGDEALKLAISDARDLLGIPDLLSSGGLADRFSARIVEAFRKARRQVAATYLEDQVERALLEKRLYQRREVFGHSHVRALLALPGPVGAAEPQKPPPPPPRPWPVYLSEAMARKLPMFARFHARLLVEAHLQEDQFETHPNALRAMALVRVVTIAPKEAKPAKATS